MEQNPYQSPLAKPSPKSPVRRGPRLRGVDFLIVAIVGNVAVALENVYLAIRRPDQVLDGRILLIVLNIACIVFLLWLRGRIKRRTEPPKLPLNDS